MPKSKFECTVCGKLYDDAEQATACETQTYPPLLQVGLVFKHRYRMEYYGIARTKRVKHTEETDFIDGRGFCSFPKVDIGPLTHHSFGFEDFWRVIQMLRCQHVMPVLLMTRSEEYTDRLSDLTQVRILKEGVPMQVPFIDIFNAAKY